MKTLLLLLGTAVSVTAALATDATNAPAKPPRAPTQIFSDRLEADLKTRTAVYLGNVRVEDEQMNLTCEKLTVNIPATGGRPESMIAEQNVVVLALDEKGLTNRATGDQLIYTYKVEGVTTNEFIELLGSPRVVTPQAIITGDRIMWDRIKNSITAENQHMELLTDPVPPPVPLKLRESRVTNAPAEAPKQ